jgi:hypothetical protein
MTARDLENLRDYEESLVVHRPLLQMRPAVRSKQVILSGPECGCEDCATDDLGAAKIRSLANLKFSEDNLTRLDIELSRELATGDFIDDLDL